MLALYSHGQFIPDFYIVKSKLQTLIGKGFGRYSSDASSFVITFM